MDDYAVSYERGCELMPLAEAAHRLGKGTDTVKEWARSGRIDWCDYMPPERGKSSGQWIVRRRAFENWCSGGAPVVHQQIIIDTQEGYEALCRAAIHSYVDRR